MTRHKYQQEALPLTDAKTGALLVISTKSPTSPVFARVSEERLNSATGEIETFTYSHKNKDFVKTRTSEEVRNERFMLQTASAKLLAYDAKLHATTPHRVVRCLRSRVKGDKEYIPINSIDGKAHYSNLQVCGSVWSCPVCASKISEHRRKELRHVVDTHLAAGGGVVMVTLTFPHYKFDVLADLLQQFKHSLTRYKSGAQYAEFKENSEIIGVIRAIEVTHGVNGWHPHAHELVLLPKPLDEIQMCRLHADLYKFWSRACVKSGLPLPSQQYGVHVQDATSAADYIAKFGCEPSWEVARELVNANTKKSKDQDGATPFDLLRKYNQGDLSAGLLYVEFANAFFGWRQLFWSKGLKQLFKLKDLTDDEVVKDEVETIEITRLSIEYWRAILNCSRDTRAIVLQIAENGGHDAVQSFVASLPACPADGLRDMKFKKQPTAKAKKKKVRKTADILAFNSWRFPRFAKNDEMFKKAV